MPNLKPYKIFIVAGEASGDAHGAKLVNDIKQANPNCSFSGVGGSQLRAQDVQLIVNSNELSIVGISEALVKLKLIWRSLQQIKHYLRQQQPDLVILIDFPDFNLMVAKAAKKLGIKVLYYISPQLWAWRPGRIKTIKRYVDHMAVVFPFEVKFYQAQQIPVTFVGHPLANAVNSQLSKSQARQALGLKEELITIGLVPGSRHTEIERLLPDILSAAEILQVKYPQLQFVLPLAVSIPEELIHAQLAKTKLTVSIVKQRTYDVMQACDIAITASGTVTLEAALMQLPMVVIYKVSALSYWLARYLIKIPYISLTNIIAGRKIVPELIQDAVKPIAIATEVEKTLNNPVQQAQLKTELNKIKQNLDANTGTKTVAELAINLLTDY